MPETRCDTLGVVPPPTRDYPRSGTSSDVEPQSAAEVCGKLGFFARNVCLDERCEEPRFRNIGECPKVLARTTEYYDVR